MRCSEASADRHEPLAGTGPTERRWLMIEIPGAWQAKPLDTPPIDADAKAALTHAERTHDARVVLVHRPGRRGDVSGARRWWAVDTRTHTEVAGEWGGPDELVDAAHALGDELDASTAPARRSLLVCTHARRDQCCAIGGRPLARELAERWPAETWECTHLGGHRFAPTFAVLPDGVTYGRVPAGEGVAVVEGHLACRLPTELLRGRAGLTAYEQAAWVHGLVEASRTGLPAGPADVTVESSGETGPGRWWLRVRTPAGPRGVTIEAVEQDPMPLSCGPADPKPSTTYAVTPASP